MHKIIPINSLLCLSIAKRENAYNTGGCHLRIKVTGAAYGQLKPTNHNKVKSANFTLADQAYQGTILV